MPPAIPSSFLLFHHPLRSLHSFRSPINLQFNAVLKFRGSTEELGLLLILELVRKDKDDSSRIAALQHGLSLPPAHYKAGM